MTITTRNLTLTLVIGLLVGAGAFGLYKSRTGAPGTFGEQATTTPQTASTTPGLTAGEQQLVDETLAGLDLKAMIDRARALKNAGDYSGAIAVLTKAASIYPNDTVSFNNLADIYMNFKKDYPKAELNYKKVIANNVTQLDAYRHLFELYTTTSYKPTNTAPADIVAAAIKVVPTAYDLQLLLARYYRDTGDRAAARVQYRAAIDNAKSQGLAAVAADMQSELDALPQ